MRVAALGAHLNLNRINLENEEKQASLSGEHDSLGRGERAPVFRAQDIPLVRGMG